MWHLSDMCDTEWHVWHWVTCVTLSDMCDTEWRVWHWVSCLTLSDMCDTEWHLLTLTALSLTHSLQIFHHVFVASDVVIFRSLFSLHKLQCSYLHSESHISERHGEYSVSIEFQCYITDSITPVLHYGRSIKLSKLQVWFAVIIQSFQLLTSSQLPTSVCVFATSVRWIVYRGCKAQQWLTETVLEIRWYDDMIMFNVRSETDE